MAVDVQRVVGWLALRLNGRSAGLLGGARADYKVTDTGMVVVSWETAPAASEVAAALCAIQDPDLPVVEAPKTAIFMPSVAWLMIGSVPVQLVVDELDPAAEPAWKRRGRARDAAWTWPMPLAQVGAAQDHVLWHDLEDPATSATGGSGDATVVRTPATVRRAWSPHWPQPGYVIVDPEHAPPAHAVRARQRFELSRALAEVWLHMMDKPDYGTSPHQAVNDADAWAGAHLQPYVGPPMVAVLDYHSEWCVIRTRAGHRIFASTTHGRPAASVWTYLPAVAMDAMDRLDKRCPRRLTIRPFGDGGHDEDAAVFDLAATLVVPAWP